MSLQVLSDRRTNLQIIEYSWAWVITRTEPLTAYQLRKAREWAKRQGLRIRKVGDALSIYDPAE